MKKLLVTFLSLGLLSQHALAVTVQGVDFESYVDTVVSKSSGVWMDTGLETDQKKAPIVSYELADVTASITDLDAGTWVGGYFDSDYIDLAFNTSVANVVGNDLEIFFVGSGGQTVGMTIGTETNTYVLAPEEGKINGASDSVYGLYPIVKLAIDLDDFTGVSSLTEFRLTVGDRWCGTDDAVVPNGECSSLPSFVGGYNAVPVPAAVWLFGSGLLGLVGVARRRR